MPPKSINTINASITVIIALVKILETERVITTGELSIQFFCVFYETKGIFHSSGHRTPAINREGTPT